MASTEKVSVSLGRRTVALGKRQAARQGISFSSWLDNAARTAARVEGVKATAQWEAAIAAGSRDYDEAREREMWGE